jgi:hypothetical protein
LISTCVSRHVGPLSGAIDVTLIGVAGGVGVGVVGIGDRETSLDPSQPATP